MSGDPNKSDGQIPGYFISFFNRLDKKLDRHAEKQDSQLKEFRDEIRAYLFNEKEPKNGLAFRFDRVEQCLDKHLTEHEKQSAPGNKSERRQTIIMAVTVVASTIMSVMAMIVALFIA